MAGINIKQLNTRTSPALTDYFYTVDGSTDYNVTLQKIKDLFGIEENTWKTATLTSNSTTYVNTEIGSTNYAVVKLEVLFKRGSRSYRTAQITAMYDGSQVVVSVFDEVNNNDNDYLGITISGGLTGGQIQLQFDIDGSDLNDVVMNYKIIVNKPISV